METPNKINFNKIRTWQEIFSDTLEFLKTEWKMYLLVLTVFVFPFAFAGAYFLNNGKDLFIETGEGNADIYLALLFSLVSKFLGIMVTCGYVTLYLQNTLKEIGISDIWEYVSQNFMIGITPFLFFVFLLFFAFLLFVIPGIILLPPLSYFMYDILIRKADGGCRISFSRCLILCKTNMSQCFLTVYLTYIILFMASALLAFFVPANNEIAGLVVSSIGSVITAISMLPFIFLYYSLANQNLKYGNN